VSKCLSLTNVYEAAFDINNIVGNLDITLFPLYYTTHTLVGCSTNTVIINQPGISRDASNNPISLLNFPSGIAIDLSGNIFFSDTDNNRICKLDTSGNLLTYAGSTNGQPGYVNGSPISSRFNKPTALVIDRSGTIYIADTGNNSIRIIEHNYIYDSSGNIVNRHAIVGTLVGNSPTQTSSGIGTGNLLRGPRGVAVDSKGTVYISDTNNHRICKIVAGGILETMAGLTAIGNPLMYQNGFLDAEGEDAAFNTPNGICVDLIGNVFVADTGNNVIRRITPSGKVSTVAGNGQRSYKEGKKQDASFNSPIGIAVDLNNVLYITDSGNNIIQRITNEGNVIPVVGSSKQLSGSMDGFGATDPSRSIVPFSKRATFFRPTAIAVDPNRTLYVADSRNNTIRKIVPTFSTPVKIKAIAMQDLRISHSPGVAYTLGPTLSAPPPHPNSIVYGHKRGCGPR
jgi:sugar lactone lactonase YvrE